MQTKEDRFALAADDIRGITIEVSVPFQHVQKPGLRFLASGAVNARKLFKRGHDGSVLVRYGSPRRSLELPPSSYLPLTLILLGQQESGSGMAGKKHPRRDFRLQQEWSQCV
jgi:hypothetical protein